MKNTAAEPAASLSADGMRNNLEQIEEQIVLACRAAGRPRDEVALMAVSKMHPAEFLVAAYALGVRLFGENKVQEFELKRREFGSLPGAAFHFIGHLQSNKAAKAAELFDSIDTVDSVALAERLNMAASKLGKRVGVLAEIKLSHEAAKAGVLPDSPELGLLLERLPDFTSLSFCGLMTVPPYLEDLTAVRPYFARLRKLRDQLAAAHPRLSFAELSMGMSHDFPVAIAEGATQIRVGTALFGPGIILGSRLDVASLSDSSATHHTVRSGGNQLGGLGAFAPNEHRKWFERGLIPRVRGLALPRKMRSPQGAPQVRSTALRFAQDDKGGVVALP